MAMQKQSCVFCGSPDFQLVQNESREAQDADQAQPESLWLVSDVSESKIPIQKSSFLKGLKKNGMTLMCEGMNESATKSSSHSRGSRKKKKKKKKKKQTCPSHANAMKVRHRSTCRNSFRDIFLHDPFAHHLKHAYGFQVLLKNTPQQQLGFRAVSILFFL